VERASENELLSHPIITKKIKNTKKNLDFIINRNTFLFASIPQKRYFCRVKLSLFKLILNKESQLIKTCLHDNSHRLGEEASHKAYGR